GKDRGQGRPRGQGHLRERARARDVPRAGPPPAGRGPVGAGSPRRQGASARGARASDRGAARVTGPRLDVWMVEHGLAESREKAQALVMAGRVRVDGARAGKPGDAVAAGAAVELIPGPDHVGRGAIKLEGA